jgi:hypothetical protein
LTISFVYPNTSEIPQRGGLEERWSLAGSAECSYIEVPADLIKKGSEVIATGQELCTFLSKESIKALYKPKKNTSGNIPYILHTEPSLSRTDGFGLKTQAPLKWFDQYWVADFVRMIINISDYFGIPPAKIEIHPGDRRNSFSDIARSVKSIQKEYEDKFGVIPDILLENRTGQFISEGAGITKFWNFILQNNPELVDRFGIVLDIQQLSTVTKEAFLPSLFQIPNDSLKGFHVHRLHRPPKLDDGIPWGEVFTKISGIHRDIIINPEIHHNNQVKNVIGFCRRLLE